MRRSESRALARRLLDAGIAAAMPGPAVARAVHDLPAPALIVAVGKAAPAMTAAARAAFPDVPAFVLTTHGAAEAAGCPHGRPGPTVAVEDAGRPPRRGPDATPDAAAATPRGTDRRRFGPTAAYPTVDGAPPGRGANGMGTDSRPSRSSAEDDGGPSGSACCVRIGGHPVPSADGVRAAEEMLRRVAAADGPVLALISGGASALGATPAGGLSADDLARATEALLASGLDIVAMNRVRQALSATAGGGLARAARHGATALILSDVVGDDVRAIGSGPLAPPLGTPAEAADALQAAGLWDAMPAAVRRHLQTAPAPPPTPEVPHLVVGSGALSLAAMAAAAPGARVVDAPLTGDVADAAAQVAAEPGDLVLWRGETTVRVRGPGLGGRNQELALRVAQAMEGPFVFLSAGTDGRDGPTDAAGGLVDDGTLGRIAAAGRDPAADLAANDSYPALAAAGNLLRIGETGTNVADLQILIRPPGGAWQA